jgi:dihydroorotase
LIHRPEDQFLAGTAMVNESEQTVNLGMKGIPILAESIMLQRDIALAKYHNTRIHIHHVSTAESLEMIKEAKKQGVQITCDVSMNHLLFDDAMLSSFEEHFKVKPPLRTKKDQKALIEGLKSGIIDAIVSQHSPKDIESKNVEFQIASFGNIGLQQCFPALFEQLSNTLGLETLVKALSSGPNKILGLANPDFVEGETANFVLIDQNNPWSMNAANNQSTSFNSPFVNAQFKARVVAMAHNQQFEILHYA